MKVAGDYKYGVFSPRCKNNVQYRRWLITEWDIKPYQKNDAGEYDTNKPLIWFPLINEWKRQGISTQAAQVRLIAEMYGRELPLGMVVFSGNESLHSWWAVAGGPNEKIERFIRYAESIGVDTTVARDIAHYVRMPHGKRPDGRRQPVVYLNPAVLKSNTRNHNANR
jgi:hypothetical protein